MIDRALLQNAMGILIDRTGGVGVGAMDTGFIAAATLSGLDAVPGDVFEYCVDLAEELLPQVDTRYAVATVFIAMAAGIQAARDDTGLA